MNPFIITLLQVLAAIGFGAYLLKIFGVLAECNNGEALTLSFAAGVGFLGWLVFIVGITGFLTPLYLGLLLVLGLPGLLLLRSPFPLSMVRFNFLEWALMALIILAFFFDITEALSPPGDADTLAYHFGLPQKFIAAGRINFEPRAMDGAVPLLVQMTYVPVLALGGETALTLWTFLSGWALGALLFVFAKRWLPQTWSLAIVLVFMTTAAVVYGAGSGQVEVRNALFVLLAAFATGKATKTGQLKYAVLAGIAVGFFVGTKYLGLLFAVAIGIVLIAQKGWLLRGTVYSIAVFAVGTQWYLWNFLHTGDPVFPVLFDFIGNPDIGIWDIAHQTAMHSYMDNELAVPINLWQFLAYPFKVTLSPLPAFDATRVGFGPFPLLLAPFAAAGIWHYRSRISIRNELVVYAVIAFLYYVFWFFSGSSQRVRHLLPILPLILIVLTVSAERYTANRPSLKPVGAAFAFTILLQLTGHTVFSLKSIHYVFSDESRDAYLGRMISFYEAVPWINANLDPSHKVLSMVRWYEYLLEIPYYRAETKTQSLINLLPEASSPELFFQQAQAQGVTHILSSPTANEEKGSILNQFISALQQRGCLIPIQTFSGSFYFSRTLASLTKTKLEYSLYKVSEQDNKPCLISK